MSIADIIREASVQTFQRFGANAYRQYGAGAATAIQTHFDSLSFNFEVTAGNYDRIESDDEKTTFIIYVQMLQVIGFDSKQIVSAAGELDVTKFAELVKKFRVKYSLEKADKALIDRSFLAKLTDEYQKIIIQRKSEKEIVLIIENSVIKAFKKYMPKAPSQLQARVIAVIKANCESGAYSFEMTVDNYDGLKTDEEAISMLIYTQMLEILGYDISQVIDPQGTLDIQKFAELIKKYRAANGLTNSEKPLIDHALLQKLVKAYKEKTLQPLKDLETGKVKYAVAGRARRNAKEAGQTEEQDKSNFTETTLGIRRIKLGLASGVTRQDAVDAGLSDSIVVENGIEYMEILASDEDLVFTALFQLQAQLQAEEKDKKHGDELNPKEILEKRGAAKIREQAFSYEKQLEVYEKIAKALKDKPDEASDAVLGAYEKVKQALLLARSYKPQSTLTDADLLLSEKGDVPARIDAFLAACGSLYGKELIENYIANLCLTDGYSIKYGLNQVPGAERLRDEIIKLRIEITDLEAKIREPKKKREEKEIEKIKKDIEAKKAIAEVKVKEYYAKIKEKVKEAGKTLQFEAALALVRENFTFEDWARGVETFWSAKPTGSYVLDEKTVLSYRQVIDEMFLCGEGKNAADADTAYKIAEKELIDLIMAFGEGLLTKEEAKATAAELQGTTYILVRPDKKEKEWTKTYLCTQAKPKSKTKLLKPSQIKTVRQIYGIKRIDQEKDPAFVLLSRAAGANLPLLVRLAFTNPGLGEDTQFDSNDFAKMLLISYGGRLAKSNYREIVPDYYLSEMTSAAAETTASSFAVFAAEIGKRKELLQKLIEKHEPQMTVDEAWQALEPILNGRERIALVYNQNLDAEITIENVSFVLISQAGFVMLNASDDAKVKLLQALLREYFPLHPRSYGLKSDDPKDPYVTQSELSILRQSNFRTNGELSGLEAVSFSLLRDLLNHEEWKSVPVKDRADVLQKAIQAASIVISHLVTSGEFSKYFKNTGEAKTAEAFQKVQQELAKAIKTAFENLDESVNSAQDRINSGDALRSKNLASEIETYEAKLLEAKNKGYDTVEQQAELQTKAAEIRAQLRRLKARQEEEIAAAEGEQREKIAKEQTRGDKDASQNEISKKLARSVVEGFAREYGLQTLSGSSLSNVAQMFQSVAGILISEYEAMRYQKFDEAKTAEALTVKDGKRPGLFVINGPFLSAVVDRAAASLPDSASAASGGSAITIPGKIATANVFATGSLDVTAEMGDSVYAALTVAPLAVLRLFIWRRMSGPNPIVERQGRASIDISRIKGKDIRAILSYLKEERLMGTAFVNDKKMMGEDIGSYEAFFAMFEEVADYLDKNPGVVIDNSFVQKRLQFDTNDPNLNKINNVLEIVYGLMGRIERLAQAVEREMRNELVQTQAGQSYRKGLGIGELFDSMFKIPAPALLKAPEIIDRNRILGLKAYLFREDIRRELIDDKNPVREKIKVISSDGKEVEYARSYFEGALSDEIDSEWILRFVSQFGSLVEQSFIATVTGAPAELGTEKDPIEFLRAYAKANPNKKFRLAYLTGESRDDSMAKLLLMGAIQRWRPGMDPDIAGATEREAVALRDTARGMVVGQSVLPYSTDYPYGMYLKTFLLEQGKLGYSRDFEMYDNQVTTTAIKQAGAHFRNYIERLKGISDAKKRDEEISRFIDRLQNDGLRISSLDNLEDWIKALENAKDGIKFDFVYGNSPKGLETIADALQVFVRSILPYFRYNGEGEEAGLIIESLISEAVEAAKVEAESVGFSAGEAPSKVPYKTKVWDGKVSEGILSGIGHFFLKGIEFNLLMHFMIQLPNQTGTPVQLSQTSGPYAWRDRADIGRSTLKMLLNLFAFKMMFPSLMIAGYLDVENGNTASGIYQFIFAWHVIKGILHKLKNIPNLPTAIRELLGRNLAEWKKQLINMTVTMEGPPEARSIARRMIAEAFDLPFRAGTIATEPFSEIARIIDWFREEAAKKPGSKLVASLNAQFSAASLKFWRDISLMTNNPDNFFVIELPVTFRTPDGKPIRTENQSFRIRGRDCIRLLRLGVVKFRFDGGLLIPHILDRVDVNLRTSRALVELMAGIRADNPSNPNVEAAMRAYLELAGHEVSRFRWADFLPGTNRETRVLRSASNRTGGIKEDLRRAAVDIKDLVTAPFKKAAPAPVASTPIHHEPLVPIAPEPPKIEVVGSAGSADKIPEVDDVAKVKAILEQVKAGTMTSEQAGHAIADTDIVQTRSALEALLQRANIELEGAQRAELVRVATGRLNGTIRRPAATTAAPAPTAPATPAPTAAPRGAQPEIIRFNFGGKTYTVPAEQFKGATEENPLKVDIDGKPFEIYFRRGIGSDLVDSSTFGHRIFIREAVPKSSPASPEGGFVPAGPKPLSSDLLYPWIDVKASVVGPKNPRTNPGEAGFVSVGRAKPAVIPTHLRELAEAFGLTETDLKDVSKNGEFYVKELARKLSSKNPTEIWQKLCADPKFAEIMSDPAKRVKLFELLDLAQRMQSSREALKVHSAAFIVGLVSLFGIEKLAEVLGIDDPKLRFVFILSTTHVVNTTAIKFFEKDGWQKAYVKFVEFQTKLAAQGSKTARAGLLGRVIGRSAGSFSLNLVKGFGEMALVSNALRLLGITGERTNMVGSFAIPALIKGAYHYGLARGGTTAARLAPVRLLGLAGRVLGWAGTAAFAADTFIGHVDGAYQGSLRVRLMEQLKEKGLYDPSAFETVFSVFFYNAHLAGLEQGFASDFQTARQLKSELVEADKATSVALRAQISTQLLSVSDQDIKSLQGSVEGTIETRLINVSYHNTRHNRVSKKDICAWAINYMREHNISSLDDSAIVPAVVEAFDLKSDNPYLADQFMKDMGRVYLQQQIALLYLLDPERPLHVIRTRRDGLSPKWGYLNDDIRTMFNEDGTLKQGQIEALRGWTKKNFIEGLLLALTQPQEEKAATTD